MVASEGWAGLLTAIPSRPELVVSRTPPHEVLAASVAWLEATGYSEMDVVGQRLSLVHGSGTCLETASALAAAVQMGRHCSVRLVVQSRAGLPTMPTIIVAPVDGNPVCVLHFTFGDLPTAPPSMTPAALSSCEFASSAPRNGLGAGTPSPAASSSQAYAATELQPPWRFTSANESFCRLLGYSEDALRGETFDLFFGAETDADAVASLRLACSKAHQMAVRVVAYDAAQTPFILTLHMAPVGAGVHSNTQALGGDSMSPRPATACLLFSAQRTEVSGHLPSLPQPLHSQQLPPSPLPKLLQLAPDGPGELPAVVDDGGSALGDQRSGSSHQVRMHSQSSLPSVLIVDDAHSSYDEGRRWRSSIDGDADPGAADAGVPRAPGIHSGATSEPDDRLAAAESLAQSEFMPPPPRPPSCRLVGIPAAASATGDEPDGSEVTDESAIACLADAANAAQLTADEAAAASAAASASGTAASASAAATASASATATATATAATSAASAHSMAASAAAACGEYEGGAVTDRDTSAAEPVSSKACGASAARRLRSGSSGSSHHASSQLSTTTDTLSVSNNSSNLARNSGIDSN